MNLIFKVFLLTGLSTLLLPAYANITVDNSHLLENRFRIDHGVEQLTLFIEREPGSGSTIVVQPDGRKWYLDRHPENVRWNVTDSNDMIAIDAPTPGPWQLLGKILPSSELTMVTDVKIAFEPLPETVYRGQRLKATAEVLGDGQRIDIRDFHKQLNWELSLSSYNRAGDENFAAGSFIIGGYQDNGVGLDERPGDGLFTSEIDFNYPSGLYRLRVNAGNDVYNRQIRQNIEILPQPIRLDLPTERSEDLSSFHLTLNLTSDFLPEQTHLALRFKKPNNQQHEISVTMDNDQMVLPLEFVDEFGHYTINGEMIATRLDGQEIYLTLPQITFHAAKPASNNLSRAEMEMITLQESMLREQQARSRILWTIGSINILFLLAGGAIIAYWRKQLRLKAELLAVQDNIADDPFNVNENLDLNQLQSNKGDS